MHFPVSLPPIMQHYTVIPIISTVAGFLCGWLLRLIVLKRLPTLLQQSVQQFSTTLFNTRDIQEALTAKNNFPAISPFIEVHIDEFLNHKLGKEMPMIGMFIGDKTIAQLKSVFMKELEEIFPLVIDKYMEDISGKLNIGTLISEKISSLPADTLRTLVDNTMGRSWQMIPVYGALAGLLTGTVQLTLLFLLS